MPTITLNYDVVSPYSFFALAVLKRYRAEWGIDLVLKTGSLKEVIIQSGNTPPMACKNKLNWLIESDMPLAAKYFDIDFTWSGTFPFDTFPALRILKVVEEKYGQGEIFEKLVDAYYSAIWQPSAGSSALEAVKPENVNKLAASLLPAEDVDDILKLAASEEIGEKLKTEAGKLVEEGAFGFPFIVVEKDDGEKRSFWGHDRFEQIAFWLGKEWKGPTLKQ